MAFCKHCGADVGDVKFCPTCGTRTEITANDFEEKFSDVRDAVEEKFNQFNDTPDSTEYFDPVDIRNNKLLCIFAYLGILVLIPFFCAAKESKYARFHVNQGLILFIASVVWGVAERVIDSILEVVLSFSIPGVYGLISGAVGLLGLFFTVLTVIGVVNVVQGKAKELPIIGGFRILK